MPSNQNISDLIKTADDALSRASRYFGRQDVEQCADWLDVAREAIDDALTKLRGAKK